MGVAVHPISRGARAAHHAGRPTGATNQSNGGDAFLSDYSTPEKTFSTMEAAVRAGNRPAFQEAFHRFAREQCWSKIARGYLCAHLGLTEMREILKQGYHGTLGPPLYDDNEEHVKAFIYNSDHPEARSVILFKLEGSNRWKIYSFTPYEGMLADFISRQQMLAELVA